LALSAARRSPFRFRIDIRATTWSEWAQSPEHAQFFFLGIREDKNAIYDRRRRISDSSGWSTLLQVDHFLFRFTGRAAENFTRSARSLNTSFQ
jgi:hypothetical protein